MKPPGSNSLRQPGCGGRRRPALLPLLGRLVSLLLLLHGSCVPRARAAAAAAGLHWNETASSIEEVLADEESTFQQSNSSNSKNNSYSNAIQKEITLPSRLIYYINRDSETPYHILDTRARHQQKHDKAVHLAQASFQIEAFDSKFILDLTLNNCKCTLEASRMLRILDHIKKNACLAYLEGPVNVFNCFALPGHNAATLIVTGDLLSSNYVEIYYEDGKPKFSKGGEHCYYHGNIRGVKDSKVALSTCNGLHGMFEDSTYLYLIEPMDLTHTTESKSRPHIIQRTYGTQTSKQLRDLGMFSHIQRSPVLKKKDSFEDLISIHIHKSRSILLGRVIGKLGKKTKLHI